MIGTLAVDGWAVTFGIARRGLGPAQFILFDVALAVPIKGLTVPGLLL